jgi:hypothetical protein
VLAEGVELALQVRHGGGGRLAGQPAFLGLVESPGLALSLGRFGLPLMISESAPPARAQWLKSDCQHWLG